MGRVAGNVLGSVEVGLSHFPSCEQPGHSRHAVSAFQETTDREVDMTIFALFFIVLVIRGRGERILRPVDSPACRRHVHALQLVVFLPFHPAVLEPDFDLSL